MPFQGWGSTCLFSCLVTIRESSFRRTPCDILPGEWHWNGCLRARLLGWDAMPCICIPPAPQGGWGAEPGVVECKDCVVSMPDCLRALYVISTAAEPTERKTQVSMNAEKSRRPVAVKCRKPCLLGRALLWRGALGNGSRPC